MTHNVSILIPVINETWSLQQTVDIVIAENHSDIKEIIILVSNEKTLHTSITTIQYLQTIYPKLIKLEAQTLPFIGGAMITGFDKTTGEYTLIMASDLETDPHLVKEMIAQIKLTNSDIIATSRWIKGGEFGQYARLKKYLNYLFQKLFSFIYHTKLTDMTYGFRIYKTEILKKIIWTSRNHEIFLETLVKPLRLGYQVIEIPAKWSARSEGVSQVRFSYFAKYFWVGFITRVIPKRYFSKA